VLELREVLYSYSYLEEEEYECAEMFWGSEFLSELAYLCGLFEKLNALNLSLQGNNTYFLKLVENILAFSKSYYNG